MIKFFKVNDPYRFAVLTIALVIIRSVIFYFGIPLTQIELKFLLASRTLMDGKWLYRDLWETTEPLTTLIYYLLPQNPETFSLFSYWLNVALLLFNAFYANYILQKLDILSDKTFIPALFYLLISLAFFELNVLSAPLLASTFLLFVISNMFGFFKKENFYRMYDTGLFLGIASLFFLPSIAFIPSVFIALLFFTRSQGKSYLLFTLGFLFPWIITLLVFLWVEGVNEFVNVFLNHYFLSFQHYTDSTETLFIFILPTALFLCGIIFSLRGIIREINFQSICRKFLLIWIGGGILCCIISPVKCYSLLYIIIFPLSFFYSFYYLQIKQYLIPNLILLAFIIVSVYIQSRCISGTLWQKSIHKIKVVQSHDPFLDDKKIWVSGKNQNHYLYGKVAGRYLNWDVSQDDFGNTNKFFAIENIRKNFYNDMPEVIIDESNVMPDIFDKIPQLKNHYQVKDKGIYVLYLK